MLRSRDLLQNRLPEIQALNSLDVAFSAIYFWEFVITLDFEWAFVTNRKKFTWPMVPYFLGRYLALIFACLNVYRATPRSNVTKLCPELFDEAVLPVACTLGAQNTLYGIAFVMLPALASMNLSIRALAIWSFNIRVAITLFVLTMAHLAVTIYLLVNESSSSSSTLLVPLMSSDSFAGIVELISASVVDAVIFVLASYRLFFPRLKHSVLVNRMLQEGLVYFLLTIAVIIPFTVKMANFSVVPITMMTIISGRLARRRSNFSTSQPAIYIMTEDKLVLRTHIKNGNR
ncbi:hypothetical protein BXZ70DRAFT_201080 [Cristinia sonorae]|uniref:DUF6533 domain-containing protein n=1 Tax=Cristinia sonorae TaxID=1940300 RepID=A0A8K0XPF1_9AGAR|nr:hypothetical protein BXZ70DRAFT_201080 [Cristinia sonorae]